MKKENKKVSSLRDAKQMERAYVLTCHVVISFNFIYFEILILICWEILGRALSMLWSFD